MSLAPSAAVPRAGFNPLPLYIALFCLLWSFAFVAGKIGVTDCPPLMLLAFLVLGEHVEFRDLLGIVPVALGIYLVTRPGKTVARSATSTRRTG